VHAGWQLARTEGSEMSYRDSWQRK